MSGDYASLATALAPEAALVGGALAALGLDLGPLRRKSEETRLNVAVAVAALAILAAMGFACSLGAVGEVYGGVVRLDSLALLGRLGVLGLALLTLGVATGARAPRNPAEFVAVLLFATTGLTLMAAAEQLLIAFLALELASLALYVLVGFDKSRPESAEAGLKYFLFGGISAAFLLFGFSLIYGLTGSIDLPTISVMLAHQPFSPLLAVALVMVLVAFGYKSAAAPFHLWAPDAYEGAPAPAAALVASASKLAGFILFLRLLWSGLFAASGDVTVLHGGAGWLAVLVVLSGCSILLGNIAALAQSNVRRLLAYSAIAHAGGLLLGVIAANPAGPGALYFYALTYGIATVGAFGVVAVVDRAGRCQQLTDLAGLRQRSPLLTVCLLVFVLSLAGVPPLAGFLGKFYVFANALKLGGLAAPAGWLAILAILFSAVGLYYYLLILKQALVAPAATDAAPVRTPFVAAATLVAAAAALLALGVWPSVVLRLF